MEREIGPNIDGNDHNVDRIFYRILRSYHLRVHE